MSMIFPAGYQFFDSNGSPLDAGTINFYRTGTTTDKAIYTDRAMSSAAANPYTLDSDGRIGDNLYGTGLYTILVKTSGGITVFTRDEVDAGVGAELNVANIAAMTALDVTALASDYLWVAGYYAAADGGGGWFQYVSGSSDTADGGVTFAPDTGSGRWKRIERDRIVVEMFGAKGDGSTDDSARVIAATSYVDQTLVGGTLGFLNASYVFDANKWELNGVRGVTFEGQGGDAVENGTLITLKNNASDTELLRITSCLNLTFRNIRFAIDESTATAAAYIVVLDADDLPALSNNNIQFDHCNFNPEGTGALTANVWVYDSVHIGFKQCTFSNNPTAVLLGENLGVNPSTFGNGNAAEVTFQQCLFGGDVLQRRGWGFTYQGCHWQARVGGTCAVVGASGDQQDRQVTFIGCQWYDGDDTRTAITQGTAGENLTVQGCRFDGIAKGIVLNGTGNAVINGNFFNGTAITTGIEINNPARNVRYQGNDFDDLIAAGNAPIDDNTTTGSSAAKLRYWAVDGALASDTTITGANAFDPGSGQNNFVSVSSASFNGGKYMISYNVEIVSAETTVYEARVVVDGVQIGHPVAMTIDSGDTKTLSFAKAITIPQDDGVAVALQVKQTANSTPSTVKQDSTWLQIRDVGVAG